MRALALLLAAAAALLALPVSAQDFPELTGRVVDNADLLSPEQEAALSARLEALEQQSQRQLVVATVPTLGGYEISDYGYRLGREWGLGDEERNDGAILLVAPEERKVRIEVGYGLEPVMTDGLSFLIINNEILPRFKAGDYPGGIAAGTDALIEHLVLPPAEAAEVAQRAQVQRQGSERQGGGLDFPTIVFLLLFLFFIVIPMLSGGRRGKRYRRSGVAGAVGDVILWNMIANAAGGSSGSGWGGGGGGGGFGGGFSGGGGSFGGGGATGSW